MATLLIRAVGLDEEENAELIHLIRRLNHKRKRQHRKEVSYYTHIDRKKRYSRDMSKQLHRKKS